MGFPCWRLSPRTLTLPANEVHVWRARLDVPWAHLGTLRRTLSPDERARASQFRLTIHRRQFIAAHGILRDILSRYLHRDPAGLRFRDTPRGKPALLANCGRDEIRFNLSHSGNLALYAVTRGREVGVDLELIQPDLAGDAQQFLSPQEIASLRALPPPVRAEAFFNAWTRKEAYIKALGEGLRVPLASFDVSLAPGEAAALLRGVSSRWVLQAIKPARAYVAAVVTEGECRCTRLWQWRASQPSRESSITAAV